MKEQHGLHQKRNKLRKNCGCLLFLIALLLVQVVYGSDLGLDDQQKKALQGSYLGFEVRSTAIPFLRTLNFDDSGLQLGPRYYDRPCDLKQYSSGKFCWKTKDGIYELVLHTDDTLRLYQPLFAETRPSTVYYKINTDQTEAEIKQKFESGTDQNQLYLNNERFAELKESVSKIMSLIKIDLTNNTISEETITENKETSTKTKENTTTFKESKETSSKTKETSIKTKETSTKIKETSTTSKENSTTFKKITTTSKETSTTDYWVFICIGAFVVGIMCCFLCCDTPNEELLQNTDEPRNYFPSTTDLVLTVKEIITEQSIETEMTQYFFSVEHSNTDEPFIDSNVDFGTQSSELSKQNNSEVVSSLQFSTEDASIVESMKSESESELSELKTNQKRKTSQFPTKEEKKETEKYPNLP